MFDHNWNSLHEGVIQCCLFDKNVHFLWSKFYYLYFICIGFRHLGGRKGESEKVYADVVLPFELLDINVH